jgi:hypothetical protein
MPNDAIYTTQTQSVVIELNRYTTQTHPEATVYAARACHTLDHTGGHS